MIPISELRRTDGDLAVFFLSGAGVRFMEPIDDDWYRATTPWGSFYYYGISGYHEAWRPDVSASPMGCLQQYQWCNSAYPRDRGCGPLAGWDDSRYGAAPFFDMTDDEMDRSRSPPSDQTQARFVWPLMAIANSPTSVEILVNCLGPKSLASQTKLFSGLQSSLQQDQWQLDVYQWWQMVLAATQASRSVFP